MSIPWCEGGCSPHGRTRGQHDRTRGQHNRTRGQHGAIPAEPRVGLKEILCSGYRNSSPQKHSQRTGWITQWVCAIGDTSEMDVRQVSVSTWESRVQAGV